MQDKDEQLRAYVVEHIDQAIAEGWLRAHYQSIVRSSTGALCGEEAFARWFDPKHGTIMPGKFIPALEEAGLVYKVDLHMVDCVLADLQKKRELGVGIVPVSVNVSVTDLEHVDLAGEIAKRCDAAGESHDLLRIEFNESAVLTAADALKDEIEKLHAAGFKVWLDDFGHTSALNTLQMLGFDLVKLNTNLLSDMHSPRTRDILVGVVHIAYKLGISALAESVETEEQALLLESIGCTMLQGFYFSTPRGLGTISRTFLGHSGRERERIEEFAYWNRIGSIDLFDPTSSIDSKTVDGSTISEFPTCIIERRGGVWRIVRANQAYRVFADNGGVLSIERSNLEAHETEKELDEDFAAATERSKVSNLWERVAGRREYGTGLQFYTRCIATSPEAEAFALTAVPTMLGTALGSYGDVPVAYAVLRAVLDDANEHVIDAEYVFANSVYCNWTSYSYDDIPGRSFRKLVGDGADMWFPYFYDAAVLKRDVHDVVFSEEIGHWLSFNMAPAAIEGCFVYAFTIADDDRRERQEIIVSRDTSDLIIDITNVFNDEDDFEVAMKRVLEMISTTIHPERLFVFERGTNFTYTTFEWHAEGFASRIDDLQNLNNDDFGTWVSLVKQQSIAIVSDLERISALNRPLYDTLTSKGVESLIAVPLVDGRDIIGFLVAENYVLEEGLDTQRLLKTVGTFMSAHVVNHRLMVELERMGSHDALTGLLNRRGFDMAFAERYEADPDLPYALALIDIDDFKTVNDVNGHDVGDEALRAIARSVRGALPPGAIVGRNGGDEFVAALFGDDVHMIDSALKQLVASDLGCTHNGRWYPLSFSVGYALHPEQAKDLNDAYAKADAALYAVKLAGKDACRQYSNEVESQYRSQLGFTPRDIAENIPGAILVHRACGSSERFGASCNQGEILFTNNEFIEMLGCSDLRDFMSFTGASFANVVHPDDKARVFEQLSAVADRGEDDTKCSASFRIVTKSGTPFRVTNHSRFVEISDIGDVFYSFIVEG